MTKISIDIVICTYNNAHLLDKALLMIAQQKYSSLVNWNVLVVDNNCTDNTRQIVEKYIQRGNIPGLRIILESKQGLNHARSCGVNNTAGDWIAFVDDDCLLAPDWVEQAAQFTQNNPDCGAFGGRVILDWEIPPKSYVLNYGYCFAQQEHGDESKTVPCLVGAGMIINRKILLSTGWLDKQYLSDRVGQKLISGGDVELALRLSEISELWYNPKCQLNHVIPPRRTEFKYLLKINYGLGTSQIFGDSLLWSDYYQCWLSFITKKTIRSTKEILVPIIKASLGKQSKAMVAMNGSFLAGQWMGIIRMIFLEHNQRNQLLGCAVALAPSSREKKDNPRINQSITSS